jgi:small subunit ribosomal protein S2
LASDFVQQLVEAGIHFGHQASRWNPKMGPYILGKRNGVHLTNIKETVKGLLRGRKFISQVVSDGGDVLFVGTKRQAKAAVKAHSERVGMHSVYERWLGGTLTNFRTIRSRLSRLEELERMDETGLLKSESKKTQSRLTREREKILRNLCGIRRMSKLPGVVVVVDVKREYNAILEARKLHIPTVALIDTDSDPDLVDIPIPGNDDAIRAIEIVVSQLADAVEEGKRMRPIDNDDVAPNAPTARKRSRRPTTSKMAPGLTDEADGGEVGESVDAEGAVVMAQTGAPAPGRTSGRTGE